MKCYNFTQLAVGLNEPEDGVAPTDSRHRPDQRLMEEGQWDEANAVKMQLEEKQRVARRRRDSLLEEAAQTGIHAKTPIVFFNTLLKLDLSPSTKHYFTNSDENNFFLFYVL